MTRRWSGFKHGSDGELDGFHFKRGRGQGRRQQHIGYYDEDDTDSVASTVSLTFNRGHGRGRGQIRSSYQNYEDDYQNYENDDTDSVSSYTSPNMSRGWKKGVSPLLRRRSKRLLNQASVMDSEWSPPTDLLTKQSTTAVIRHHLLKTKLQDKPVKLQRMETSGRWNYRQKPSLLSQDTLPAAMMTGAESPMCWDITAPKLTRIPTPTLRSPFRTDLVVKSGMKPKAKMLSRVSTTRGLREALEKTSLQAENTSQLNNFHFSLGKKKSVRIAGKATVTTLPTVTEGIVLKTTRPNLRRTASASNGSVSSPPVKVGLKRTASGRAKTCANKTEDEEAHPKKRQKVFMQQMSLAPRDNMVFRPPLKSWPVNLDGQVIWKVPLVTTNGTHLQPCTGHGVYVDESRCLIGDDTGRIIELDSNVKPSRICSLPTGVKCLVEDEGFVYAGCDDGGLYDISNRDPRLVCSILGFGKLLALDVHQGVIAISDEHGHVASVDHHGDVIWNVKSSGEFGWMICIDDSGFYHGHSRGVTKYSSSGQELWHRQTAQTVIAGTQRGGVLYVACGMKILKIDKEDGLVLKTYDKAKSSCANLQSVAVGDGIVFAGAKKIVCYAEDTGDVVYILNHSSNHCTPTAMQYFRGRLFTVGPSAMSVLDFTEQVIKNAMAGMNLKPSVVQPKLSSPTIPPLRRVNTVSAKSLKKKSKSIVLECFKPSARKGQLKVRALSRGFNKMWDIQFPSELCQEGSKFVVCDMKPSETGKYYRIVGDICQVVP